MPHAQLVPAGQSQGCSAQGLRNETRGTQSDLTCVRAALILVGSLMMINVVKIKWGNVNEAVPAFLTMILMPLTFSIAYGEQHMAGHAHTPCSQPGWRVPKCHQAGLARGCILTPHACREEQRLLDPVWVDGSQHDS